VGEKNGDGRKRAGDRGDSVGDVDERRKKEGTCDARVAIGGGERGREREESVARWPAPFETKAGEAGEGVGVPGAAPRERKMGQREGAGVRRCGPAQHRRGGAGLL
jgi:hypothetical protein